MISRRFVCIGYHQHNIVGDIVHSRMISIDLGRELIQDVRTIFFKRDNSALRWASYKTLIDGRLVNLPGGSYR